MSFRKPCHMPFRKLIPPFTLTEINLVLTESVNRNFNNCRIIVGALDLIYNDDNAMHWWVNQRIIFWAQLFEGRLALNPGLNLTWFSVSFVQKHFLG